MIQYITKYLFYYNWRKPAVTWVEVFITSENVDWSIAGAVPNADPSKGPLQFHLYGAGGRASDGSGAPGAGGGGGYTYANIPAGQWTTSELFHLQCDDTGDGGITKVTDESASEAVSAEGGGSGPGAGGTSNGYGEGNRFVVLAGFAGGDGTSEGGGGGCAGPGGNGQNGNNDVGGAGGGGYAGAGGTGNVIGNDYGGGGGGIDGGKAGGAGILIIMVPT